MSLEERDDTPQCRKNKSGLFFPWLGCEVSEWQQQWFFFSSHAWAEVSQPFIAHGGKKDYLWEQCWEIRERLDNKLQNVTSYKTLKGAVNRSVTLHPVLYYLDTFI